MDQHDFVLRHLPAPPVRALEVGCGDGRLARAIAGRGYDVTAIDPDAPEGSMFHKASLEDFSQPGPFDAIVAGRSLHHIEDLDAGIDKMARLLSAGGSLILDEFAWDQMDEATANWYLSHVGEPGPKERSVLPENFPDEWVADHEGLHTYPQMKRSLGRRFRTTSFEWVPYIAHYYLERDDLIADERGSIAAGRIKPLGFRYVGKLRPMSERIH